MSHSQTPPPLPEGHDDPRHPGSAGSPSAAPWDGGTPKGTTWAQGDTAGRPSQGYPPPGYPPMPGPGMPSAPGASGTPGTTGTSGGGGASGASGTAGPAGAPTPLPQGYPAGWGAPSGQAWPPPTTPASQAAHAAPATPGAAPAPYPPNQPVRRSGLGRLGQLLLVALLTAALAAGGMWALLRGSTTAGDTAPARIVEQADPSNPNWTATAKVVTPSVVSIRVGSARSGGEGSGVIIDGKGHVVTNNHVAAAGGSNAPITVALDDRRVYDAQIVGADPDTDLAVLQLKNAPSDLRSIALGDDTKLKVGDPVMAVGNPLGLAGTVTTGIVSALNRPVSTQGEGSNSATTVVTNAIQTSAAINPGNSGGALVNSAGQLVGINSSIASLSATSGNIGIGFAIPVNEVKNVSDQLISTGKARHAQLGVQVEDTVVADGPDRRAAASIKSTVEGGPAQKSGIKAGDAVVSVDGETVDSASALQAQIRERQVGDQVTLVVVRGGTRQELKVTLGERS